VTIQDAFVSIAKDVGFHVFFFFLVNKHMFSHHILSNICVARVNIMLTLITLNGVYALLDVVIINLTQTNFIS
jgi:hypothetical protein